MTDVNEQPQQHMDEEELDDRQLTQAVKAWLPEYGKAKDAKRVEKVKKDAVTDLLRQFELGPGKYRIAGTAIVVNVVEKEPEERSFETKGGIQYRLSGMSAD